MQRPVLVALFVVGASVALFLKRGSDGRDRGAAPSPKPQAMNWKGPTALNLAANWKRTYDVEMTSELRVGGQEAVRVVASGAVEYLTLNKDGDAHQVLVRMPAPLMSVGGKATELATVEALTRGIVLRFTRRGKVLQAKAAPVADAVATTTLHTIASLAQTVLPVEGSAATAGVAESDTVGRLYASYAWKSDHVTFTKNLTGYAEIFQPAGAGPATGVNGKLSGSFTGSIRAKDGWAAAIQGSVQSEVHVGSVDTFAKNQLRAKFRSLDRVATTNQAGAH